MKSLQAMHHLLAEAGHQIEVLEHQKELPLFKDKLKAAGLFPLKPIGVEIFQVNVGKVCNQTCRHCHVDAGPDRRESMSRETADLCLDALRNSDISTLDITGGAPELNANFRRLVEEGRALGRHVIDRCNLTILLASG